MAIFNNSATLSYNGIVTTSNTTTGEILEVLSAAKTALTDSYSPGGDVAYAVSLVNTGAAALTDLTLTDDLGAYDLDGDSYVSLAYVDGSVRYFVNGVLQAAPTVDAGPPLVISGISVPAGGNAIVLYEAAVTRFASPELEGEITNTATVSGEGISDVIAQETVTADTAPVLSIVKSLSPTVVAENGRITYTFDISNSGNAAAEADDDVTLRDTFTPALSDLTVTFNGAVWTEGVNYSYDEASGLFETIPGQITVPAASFAQDPDTGVWVTTPGTATLVVTGTV